jgi:hypothetical protein
MLHRSHHHHSPGKKKKRSDKPPKLSHSKTKDWIRKETLEEKDKPVSAYESLYACLEQRFCCGSSHTVKQPMTLMVSAKEEKSFINLAKGITREQLGKLVDVASAAGFGRGAQEVFDPNYCSTLQLPSKYCSLSFHPSGTGILEEIARVFGTKKGWLIAQQGKINIYRTGAFFKQHLEVPKSTNMIGSLVVCFPCGHEGGQLVVYQDNTKQIFDFGLNSSYQGNKIQWAAFFCDCPHEILPVTSGEMLTVTYNLYVVEPPSPLATVDSFKTKLQHHIGDPTFLSKGGTLLFKCRHAYSTDALAVTDPCTALKGSDALLYSVTTRMGLRTRFQPFFHTTKGDSERYFTAKRFREFKDPIHCESEEDFFRTFFQAEEIDPDYIWCSNKASQNILSDIKAQCGNQPTTLHFYEAVLLVTIPHFDERQELDVRALAEDDAFRMGLNL